MEETKVSELEEELMKARNDAAVTKEELNSCKESLEKLQELLQVQNHLRHLVSVKPSKAKNMFFTLCFKSFSSVVF